MVEGYLGEVKPAAAPAPKAIIAPHAAYVYSGAIAASAYARLAGARDVVRRIVLIGPAHHFPFAGVATTSANAWATPLGRVTVEAEAVCQIAPLPQVCVLDEAHAPEHALEVHLPFLQVVLGHFKILPLLVGDASDGEVAEIIEKLWGGDETRFVISSDLSHFHDDARARELDAVTARAIEGLRPEDIGEGQACGRVAIRGLLQAASRHGLRAHTVAMGNSGDAAGGRAKVVGYGAWTFEQPEQ